METEAKNSKANSQAIHAAAHALLDELGIDVTKAVEVRTLAKMLERRGVCHYTTARVHLAQAVRQKRGELVKLHQGWGGTRDGAGYPAGEPRTKSNPVEAGADGE